MLIVGIWVVNAITNSVSLSPEYTRVTNESNTSILADATAYSLAHNPYGVVTVGNDTHNFLNCRLQSGTGGLDGCWNVTQVSCKYTCTNQVVMFENASYLAADIVNFTYDYASDTYVQANQSLEGAETTTWDAMDLAVVTLIVIAAVAIITLLFAGFGGVGRV